MTHILFLDIETVPKVWNFEELTDREQSLFHKKFKQLIESTAVEGNLTDAAKTLWREQAGFHAEFNKIVCVSIGKIESRPTPPEVKQGDGIFIKIKSFASDFEIDILKDLEKAMASYSSLCAHYGKEMDYPVLARKYLIHKMKVPPLLNIQGLKPWEIPLIDTMDLWKFGSFKHTASLDLIANSFGLPSPKDEMDGSMVGPTYYEGTGDLGMENSALKKIAKYCEQDVVTLINVYRCMTGYEPIENVIHV